MGAGRRPERLPTAVAKIPRPACPGPCGTSTWPSRPDTKPVPPAPTAGAICFPASSGSSWVQCRSQMRGTPRSIGMSVLLRVPVLAGVIPYCLRNWLSSVRSRSTSAALFTAMACSRSKSASAALTGVDKARRPPPLAQATARDSAAALASDHLVRSLTAADWAWPRNRSWRRLQRLGDHEVAVAANSAGPPLRAKNVQPPPITPAVTSTRRRQPRRSAVAASAPSRFPRLPRLRARADRGLRGVFPVPRPWPGPRRVPVQQRVPPLLNTFPTGCQSSRLPSPAERGRCSGSAARQFRARLISFDVNPTRIEPWGQASARSARAARGADDFAVRPGCRGASRSRSRRGRGLSFEHVGRARRFAQPGPGPAWGP